MFSFNNVFSSIVILLQINFSYWEEIFLRENFKTDDKEKIITQIEKMGADPELIDFEEEL